MTWVRNDLFLPEGQDLKKDIPFIVFAPFKEWIVERERISEQNPDHPVMLRPLLAALYGARIRGYEIRTYGVEDPRLEAWENTAVKCRVAPQ